MARLLASGATPEAVLFITIAEQDDRLQLIGSGTHGERLSALAEGLANRGVCASVRRCASSSGIKRHKNLPRVREFIICRVSGLLYPPSLQ